MHPSWRRCSSFKYSRYFQLSRLASRAPRPSPCHAGLTPRAASGSGCASRGAGHHLATFSIRKGSHHDRRLVPRRPARSPLLSCQLLSLALASQAPMEFAADRPRRGLHLELTPDPVHIANSWTLSAAPPTGHEQGAATGLALTRAQVKPRDGRGADVPPRSAVPGSRPAGSGSGTTPDSVATKGAPATAEHSLWVVGAKSAN